MSGETVNFLLGLQPQWVARSSTGLVAGGEDTNAPVSNLKSKMLDETWRTPTLKPYHTQFIADFQAAVLSRALVLGNVVLPESTAMVRVRKGDVVADEWVRPDYKTNASTDALLAAVNATGVPSSLDDDLLAGNGDTVAPTVPDNPMDFRVRMRRPTNPPKTGAYLQAIQVAYIAQQGGIAGPSITVELWQNGVYRGAAITETAFPAGEVDTWIVELKWNASLLSDASGANVEVRVVTAPTNKDALEIAAVRWLATTTKKVIRPGIDVGFLEAVNANSSDTQRLLVTDVFNPDENPTGIGPTTEGTPMTLRLGFADPGAIASTAGYQTIAVRFEQTTAGGAPSFVGTLYHNGTATGVTMSGVGSGTVQAQWAYLTFSASDLGVDPTSQIELRLVTTVASAHNIKFRGVQLLASSTSDPYTFDSGWGLCWPPIASSQWGSIDPSLIGRQPQRSVPIVFFDGGTPNLVQSLTTRYTRVEFMVAANGPWSFNEGGNTITWLDLGRYEEGSAIVGMNMAGGFDYDVVDLSTRETSAGGVVWEDEEDIYRVIKLTLTKVSGDAAAVDIYDYIARRLGITGDVLLVIFPENAAFRTHVFAWGPNQRPPHPKHDFVMQFRPDFEVRERL